MRTSLVMFICVLLAAAAHGQWLIAPGTPIALSGTPDIVVQVSGTVSNGTAFDFAAARMQLNLAAGEQLLNGPFTLTYLNVLAGTTKTINGSLTVTEGIGFTEGFLKIGTGKLLYTGAMAGLTGASDASYVDGYFTLNQIGSLTFPLGAAGLGYAPAVLENGNGTEIAMRVVRDDAGLTPDASFPGLLEIDNTHYWEISPASGIGTLGSRVSLSTNGIALGPALSPVVVESAAVGGFGTNLGSASFDGSFVTSRVPITSPLLAIGGSEEVLVKIHDIITPFTEDGINDKLYIENIAAFEVRNVTLLDRWGVPVDGWKKKEGFTNYDDPVNPNTDGYDFKKLSPGNYICIVEYGGAAAGTKKTSRMVTVLKTK